MGVFNLFTQKFDPDFNPVKISDTVSNFSSTESIVQGISFAHELTGKEYINTNSHELWDSNSTGSDMYSYFKCSGTDTSADNHNTKNND